MERVSPQIDGGRYPIKRTLGGRIVVEADAYADGHDQLAVVLRHRAAGAVAINVSHTWKS